MKGIPNRRSREPGEPQLAFSFAQFVHREPFVFANGSDNYPLALLERLRALSGMTVADLIHSRSPALRCHPIQWPDTTEPAGFSHLTAKQRSEHAPYQISISANQHGRIHGFFKAHIFHIV